MRLTTLAGNSANFGPTELLALCLTTKSATHSGFNASKHSEVEHMKGLPWIVVGVGVGFALLYVMLNEPRPEAETGWDSVENAASKAWRWGSKARLSGAGTNTAGRFKEGLGRVLGDDDLADEGVTDQLVGTVKTGAGKLAHAVGETIHDLNR